MGQKVHPYGFRLGYTKPWKSRWFAERDYDKQLLEDVKLKNELKDKLKSAGVSSIEVERPGNKPRASGAAAGRSRPALESSRDPGRRSCCMDPIRASKIRVVPAGGQEFMPARWKWGSSVRDSLT